MAGKKGPRSPRALQAAAARKSREQALRNIFARRLEDARVDKNWSQSDLAREATAHLAKRKNGVPGRGQSIGRDLISNYSRGKIRPRPEYLEAIAKALGLTREELMPTSLGAAPLREQCPPMQMTEQADGQVLLRLNRVVPMSVAIEIVNAINRVDQANEPRA